ncbi:MAG: hypothetical protein HOO94_03935 [Novosphingobium sp.]|uniref:hypothetical protein n=1 Tax=Novosphingobium sp. TaxID=1874826 RepID=UPI0018231116|nr:hypothetical protein [Novosphingobium sp.]
MIASLIVEGLGLAALAVAVPVSEQASPAEQAPFVRTRFDLAEMPRPAASAATLLRARDERLGAVVVEETPADETWTPPAKSWGRSNDGPVIELGALGSRHEWQPDVAHLSLQWQF